MLHLIERITAKELTTHSLETELKEIIRERDEIVADRFDEIIEHSPVLDIEDDVSVEEFFNMVSDVLAERLDMKSEALEKLLQKREQESSTAITSHLAIPHIVIEGTEHFDILLARSHKGIFFSEKAPEIKAVFVLAGTKDERNFHLRVLTAIAQIVQDPHFEDDWLHAKNGDVLRDIVLLGKRRRCLHIQPE